MQTYSSLFKKMLPRSALTAIRCLKILEMDYGHFSSSHKWSCVDKNGNPIPWYTYPAIEYIKQLDFSGRVVFEYGSGNSTLFWSKNSHQVISIENERQWYEKTSQYASKNIALKLQIDETAYIEEITKHEQNFDVIIVDGSYRYKCAQVAIKKLNSGGMIILDNSDWWVKTAKLLRDADLIQVDMTGFGPINHYTWTTSFFLHRKFNFRPKSVNQPEHGIGSLKQYAQEGN